MLRNVIMLDPSRVAAGIGMACGGGLAGLAMVVTALHFTALYGFPAIVRHLPRLGKGPADAAG